VVSASVVAVTYAYSGFENVNSKIFCENFPALKSGTTKIYIDGDIEKIEMIPRWWEL
jgi:phage-related protein